MIDFTDHAKVKLKLWKKHAWYFAALHDQKPRVHKFHITMQCFIAKKIKETRSIK